MLNSNSIFGKNGGGQDKVWRQCAEQKIKTALFIVLMTLTFFGIYMHDSFSLDSYGFEGLTEWPLLTLFQHGRPFADVVMYILYLLGLPPMEHQLLFAAMLIITISFSIYTIYETVLIHIGNTYNIIEKSSIFIACCVAFLNFCYQEWFNFSEAIPQFLFALFFSILAFRVHQEKRYIYAFIFLFIGLGFYQAVLGIYLMWSLLIIIIDYYKHEEKHIEMLFSFVKVMLVGGIASIGNVAVTKVATKMGVLDYVANYVEISVELLIKNILSIIYGQIDFFIQGYCHMPKMFLGFVIVVFIIEFIIILKFTGNWIKGGCTLGLLFIAFWIPFIPFVLAESMWMPPRSIVSIMSYFSILGIVDIFLLERTREKIHNRWLYNTLRVIPLALMISVLSINYYHVQKESIDLFICNELDYYLCKQICTMVDDYEMESGNTVDTVKSRYDSERESTYPHVTTNAFDTNSGAFRVKWSLNSMLEKAMKRQLKFEDMSDKEYASYFGNKEWKYFMPDEEVKFVGDTMFLVIN